MNAQTRKQIHNKIRKVRISGLMAAIVGYKLGEQWTDRQIVGICVTSDGMALLAHDDDPLYNEFLGPASEIERNLRGLAKVAGLTARQTEALVKGV